MRITSVLLLAALWCGPLASIYAQKRNDYIATDSSLTMGISLIANSPKFNSQYIKQRIRGKEEQIKYTPEQLAGYGFKDGSIYETKKIRIGDVERKVFLERLAAGKMKLYRYEDRDHILYFVSKDSSELQEVDRDLESLKPLMADCEGTRDALRLASYNRQSLRALTEHYNVCKKKPFSFKKVGVLAGWRQLTLAKGSGFDNTLLNNITIPSSGTWTVGGFADLPINSSDFSFHPELLFSRNTITASGQDGQTDVDVFITLSALDLPVLIRYTVPTPTWRVFFEVGPYVSCNIENSSDVYRATVEDDVVTIERPVQPALVADFMIGYSTGLGLQRSLNFRKTVSAAINYNWATGPDDATLKQKGLNLTVGFTF